MQILAVQVKEGKKVGMLKVKKRIKRVCVVYGMWVNVARADLNAVAVSALTTCTGREFHSTTVLGKNEYLM